MKIILFCNVYWFKAYKHNKYTCIYISILMLLIGEYWKPNIATEYEIYYWYMMFYINFFTQQQQTLNIS